MGKVIYEFMTHWDTPRRIWFKRDEDELIGTQRSGGRPMPRIRPFDLLQGPTNLPAFKPAVLWKGEDGVIEGHNHRRSRAGFPSARGLRRACLSVQRAAPSRKASLVNLSLSPGESLHVPAGVAYRLIGTARLPPARDQGSKAGQS